MRQTLREKKLLFPFRLFSVLLLLFVTGISYGSINTIDLISPDGQVKVQIELKEKIFYSVLYKNSILLEKCSLQLKLVNETLGENPKLSGKKSSTINETIQREIALRNSLVKNNCNVLLLNFKANFSVEFRAYNDGVAYRFITRKGDQDIEVLDEEVSLKFPAEFNAVLHR